MVKLGGLLVSSMVQIKTLEVSAVAGAVKIMSPHQMAAWSVLLNVAATTYLLKRKEYEFAIFNGSLLMFWLLTSVPADSGRHSLLLFAAPIVASSFLSPYSRVEAALNHSPDSTESTKTIVQPLIGALCIVAYLFGLLHFVAYALIQLKGG